MKYINDPKLTNSLICNFISSVLSSEKAVFDGTKPTYIDFTEYINISRDNNAIHVASNYNCGLCCYNVFTLTDFTFSSLYPTCQVGYENEWRKFLQKRFPSYEKDLKRYLAKQSER